MKHTDNHEQARKTMVERQLKNRGIHDQNVLDALAKVPRHLFVSEALQDSAYSDSPLPIDCQQTISQPYIVALMTEALQLTDEDIVLEIGTGSGYQAAVLAEICKTVYTIEKFPELLKKASSVFRRIGYTNIIAKTDDGTLGWPENGPYDGIIVTAGAPKVPRLLLDQLTDGGRLVIPVGNVTNQKLLRLTLDGEGVEEQRLGACRFVPLRGEHGWK